MCVAQFSCISSLRLVVLWFGWLGCYNIYNGVAVCSASVARSSSGQGWGPLEPQTRVRISAGLPLSLYEYVLLFSSSISVFLMVFDRILNSCSSLCNGSMTVRCGFTTASRLSTSSGFNPSVSAIAFKVSILSGFVFGRIYCVVT